jgi:hypothetical protein
MAGVARRVRTTVRVATRVVRSPALRPVEAAFLAFSVVEYGSWVAILLYAYAATGAASVGLVALAQLLPSAAVAPFAATLGDRYPRGRVLRTAYVLLASLTASVALGMTAGWPPVAVYAAAIATSVAVTLVRPTHNALLPTLASSPDELAAANAVTSIAEAGGLLLGPLAAAAILTQATPGAVLAILALVAAAAAVLVLRLPDARASTSVAPGTGWGEVDVLAGFRALSSDGDARLIVAILSARTLMIGVTDVLFVLLALELFGTGESGAAVLSAAMGAGGLIGGGAAFLLVGRQRIAPVLVTCAVGWGATFAVLGIVESGRLAPLLLVAGGTGLAVMDVAGRTILQRAVRDEILTRVFGILEGLMMGALAAGSILVPAVVAMVGLEASIVVFAALLPAILVLAWPGLRALDGRAIVPARALALLRRLRLFEALDPPAIEALGRSARWLSVPAGRTVIREGDAGDRYFVLESGAVTVTQSGRHVRSLSEPGDAFGEVALLEDVPRTATVTADQPSILLAIERDAFLAAVTGHPVVSADARRVVDTHRRADLDRASGGAGSPPSAAGPGSSGDPGSVNGPRPSGDPGSVTGPPSSGDAGSVRGG